jgi:hypothetical protein
MSLAIAFKNSSLGATFAVEGSAVSELCLKDVARVVED